MKNFRFIMFLMLAAFWSLVACDIPNQEVTPIDPANTNVTTIDNPLHGGGDGEEDGDDDDNDDEDGDDDDNDDGEDDNDDGEDDNDD